MGRLCYYSPRQVALACLIGSPLAGCWLMARTYLTAGETKPARISVRSGIMGAAVMIALGELLPDRFPYTTLPLVFTFAQLITARHLQTETIARCESAGIPKGPWWMAIGVGLLGALVILAVSAAGIFAFHSPKGL